MDYTPANTVNVNGTSIVLLRNNEFCPIPSQHVRVYVTGPNFPTLGGNPNTNPSPVHLFRSGERRLFDWV